MIRRPFGALVSLCVVGVVSYIVFDNFKGATLTASPQPIVSSVTPTATLNPSPTGTMTPVIAPYPLPPTVTATPVGGVTATPAASTPSTATPRVRPPTNTPQGYVAPGGNTATPKPGETRVEAPRPPAPTLSITAVIDMAPAWPESEKTKVYVRNLQGQYRIFWIKPGEQTLKDLLLEADEKVVDIVSPAALMGRRPAMTEIPAGSR